MRFSVSEMTNLVSNLQTFLPDAVASKEWLDQHNAIQIIQIQAHTDAAANREEIVKDTFVRHDKMSLLVIDLLVIEVWMDKVFPSLYGHLAAVGDPMVTFAIVSHQAVVANLLEILLHHQDAAEALSEEAAIELSDWCSRQLGWLDTTGPIVSSNNQTSIQALLSQTAEEEVLQQSSEALLTCGCCAMAILRHLIDHVRSGALSLGVEHSIQSRHETASLVASLLIKTPWERNHPYKSDYIQMWYGGQWNNVDKKKAALLLPGSPEVHAWLVVCALVLDPVAVRYLNLTHETNKEVWLRLLPKITPLKSEQLPLLNDLQRFLHALSMADDEFDTNRIVGMTTHSTRRRAVVIEYVARLRSALLNRKDSNLPQWQEVVERQKLAIQKTVDNSAVTQTLLQTLDACYCDFCEIPATEEKFEFSPTESSNQKNHAIPLIRMVDLDVFCYSTAPSQIDDTCLPCTWHGMHRLHPRIDTKPEAIQVTSKGDDENPKKTVYGTRYGLTIHGNTSPTTAKNGGRALPCHAKFAVTCIYNNGETLSCEARVSLPCSPTRNTSEEIPNCLWISIGSLNSDGLVLQIKVEKMKRATERAGDEWCVYEVVQGAVTVREGGDDIDNDCRENEPLSRAEQGEWEGRETSR